MSIYGIDCTTFHDGAVGIDPLFGLVSGADAVIESCARRLMTPRGSLRWDPAYGYDLMGKMAARMSPIARERIKAEIVTELEKDERVLKCTVLDFVQLGAGRWHIPIRIELSGNSTFTFVMAVSELTIELLREAA